MEPVERDEAAQPRYARVPAALFGHAKAAYAFGLAPPGSSRARRFMWGFALPLAALRASWRDAATRARYEEIVGTQIAALFAIGGTVALLGVKHWWSAARAEAGALGAIVAVASSVLGAVAVVEWSVVAISREYHEELTFRASQATGARGEPLGSRPRLRLDLRWLRTKIWRRLREVLLVALGLPVAAIALYLPYVGAYVYGALSAALTAYWLCVFAIANTSSAWSDPSPPPPWYLRALGAAARVPVIGLVPRAYAAIVRRVTRSVQPACAAMERAPYEAAGLALARTVASLPGLYLVTRPIFPVAAWHALRAREIEAPLPEWSVAATDPESGRRGAA